MDTRLPLKATHAARPSYMHRSFQVIVIFLYLCSTTGAQHMTYVDDHGTIAGQGWLSHQDYPVSEFE